MECDGSGRIIGGMAAIPLFAWWPIKARLMLLVTCLSCRQAARVLTVIATAGVQAVPSVCSVGRPVQEVRTPTPATHPLSMQWTHSPLCAHTRAGQNIDEVMFGKMKEKK